LWFVKGRRAQSTEDYETWNRGGVAPTLNDFDNATESRATVIMFSHTQGLDAQPSEITGPTLRKGGAGAAVATEHIYTDSRRDSIRINEGISPTLQSQMGTGGNNVPLTDNTMAVCRLTPMECERLQGFPDGWTSHRVDPKKGVMEQADSPRYKQMGNAVAVPVVEWIVRRLVEVDAEL